MKINIFFNRENWFLIFLFIFSILINQYYGNKGIFPVDSFAHFDSGFRLLLGDHPFKDYWIVSGPFIDYVQALFFYLFGVNWQSYILHASFINAVLTIATFLVLRDFKLNIFYSFLYSILFSILAYPSSGTPFVDHHSAFFSLLGIYSLILAIRNEKKIYWILLPIFFGFAFLSKQTPAAYIILFTILILITFSIIQKNFYWIKYSLFSAVLFVFFLLLHGLVQQINFYSFFEQYFLYPQSIGSKRLENFSFTYRGAIDHFKFIYIAILPIFYINFKNILFVKNYFKQKNFYYFLILLLFTFSLIFHQLLTKNQTFIFFLIPILMGFSHITLEAEKFKLSNFIFLAMILISIFATYKYHLRFNESRKFHELNYVDFDLTSKGNQIDKKFLGLKWITPEFKMNSNFEIVLINEAKSHLKKDKRNKMLMTNYSFFSVILDEKLYSPSRWYALDGTMYPLKESSYFNSFKNLLLRLIKENKIEVIYTVDTEENSNIKDASIYDYINKECFKKIKITKLLTSYELKKCNEIKD